MKERTYSESIAQAIKGYLADDDWHFSFDEKCGLFKFGLSLKGMIPPRVPCIKNLWHLARRKIRITPEGHSMPISIIYENVH